MNELNVANEMYGICTADKSSSSQFNSLSYVRKKIQNKQAPGSDCKMLVTYGIAVIRTIRMEWNTGDTSDEIDLDLSSHTMRIHV